MFQEVAQASQSVASDPVVRWCAAIVGVVTAATPIFNHVKGRRRDSGRLSEFRNLKESIERKIDDNHARTTQTLVEFGGELRDLRAFVVGPDGENGIRGDVREIKDQVKGILEREREALQSKAFGAYTPRP